MAPAPTPKAAGGAAVPASGGPIQLENTSKRDYLKGLEKKYQAQWAAERAFEIDSPMQQTPDANTPSAPGQSSLTANEITQMSPEEIREHYPKWLGTFPYPYMNGSLHLGHAFSVSKLEFATGFERMLGKKALFPFGFHATGMPIRVSFYGFLEHPRFNFQLETYP